MDKTKIKQRQAELEQMISEFCDQHLNEEYKTLSIKLLQKLGRKRDVPFSRGKLEIWSTSIIYTIGSINYLTDPSFEPYMSLNDMCEIMNLKSSTVGNKAGAIRKLLKLETFDEEFSTQKIMDNNPFNKMEELYSLFAPVLVDDEYVDFQSLPEDVQEQVIESRKAGDDIVFTTYRK
ncbi:hypothetical protein MY04_4087 [Flammeovirga sp. MY04]|uniref:DUF6398 domain-containing protein n=1 Tax=Flammeovirga sp. MY04 TaxID=1191459 RepID=UPI0008060BFD|nr:DUF6398 domain-containing protein [Flammeovirga sp. MY04]ANQ51431.1 hypothetical protein MY04_4087 [Flammeovirga sp. MY04]